MSSSNSSADSSQVVLKAESGKSCARKFVENKFPNCLLSPLNQPAVENSEVVFIDSLQRIMNLGTDLKGKKKECKMTGRSLIYYRIVADIDYAFKTLNAKTVVIAFDIHDLVPTMKGAEQAARDARRGSTTEVKSWSVEGALQYLELGTILPREYDEGMTTSREVFRPGVIKWICTNLILDRIGWRHLIPQDRCVILLGHCLRTPDLDKLGGVYPENYDLRSNIPIIIYGNGAVEFEENTSINIGEAELIGFWLPSVIMHEAKTLDRPVRFDIFSRDTDVMILGLIWLEKIRKILNPAHQPELYWTFMWGHAATLPLGQLKTENSIMSLTRLDREVRENLVNCDNPAFVIAYTYFTAGSDFTNGYFYVPHEVFFDTLFEEWDRIWSRFDWRPETILDNVLFYDSFVRASWNRRRVHKGANYPPKESGMNHEFADVIRARFLHLRTVWRYVSMVGMSSIQPPEPTRKDGYSAIDPTQPISKRNVQRICLLKETDSAFDGIDLHLALPYLPNEERLI